jgi:mRNA-degrading endonuclease YafQ of YafQ-DinJ toxin-antitoxin module
MKQIYRTSRFKKDVKRLKKQGKDFRTFQQIIKQLAEALGLKKNIETTS